MSLTNKKILFIGPDFFEYPKEISNSLRRLGAEVIFIPQMKFTFKYRIAKNSGNDIWNKAIKDYYEKILTNRSYDDFDYLFLISGKFTPIWFIKKMKKMNPNATLIMYQWDSIKNNPKINDMIEYFDKCFSFDLLDCVRNTKIEHLPLFYSESTFNNDINSSISTSVKFDLLFIGNPLSNRYSKICELSLIAKKNNINFNYYFYLPFMQYLKEIFLKKNYMSLFKIHFRKMSYKKYINLLYSTEFVLDINDINQTGLTMRTIETIASRKKLITTNSFINLYPSMGSDIFYIGEFDSNKIIKITNENQGVDQKLSCFEVKVLSTTMWLKIIFGLKENSFKNLVDKDLNRLS